MDGGGAVVVGGGLEVTVTVGAVVGAVELVVRHFGCEGFLAQKSGTARPTWSAERNPNTAREANATAMSARTSAPVYSSQTK